MLSLEFCDECGSLLYPSKDKDGNPILVCRSCGFKKKISSNTEKSSQDYRLGNRIKHSESDFTPIIEEEINVLGIVNEECEKCGNRKAYYWHAQTRSGDEAMTTFYRCTKCKHTWREY